MSICLGTVLRKQRMVDFVREIRRVVVNYWSWKGLFSIKKQRLTPAADLEHGVLLRIAGPVPRLGAAQFHEDCTGFGWELSIRGKAVSCEGGVAQRGSVVPVHLAVAVRIHPNSDTGLIRGDTVASEIVDIGILLNSMTIY